MTRSCGYSTKEKIAILNPYKIKYLCRLLNPYKYYITRLSEMQHKNGDFSIFFRELLTMANRLT